MDKRERILIVDDDKSTCKSLSLIFEEKGYETELAETGQEALEKAQGKFFNLALLDIMLPDMKGVELLKPLKTMHPDTVAIMMTAYASLETAMRALNEGASAYITKPLNMNETLATIRGTLEKQHLVMENQRLYEAVQQELAERKRIEKDREALIKELEAKNTELEQFTYTISHDLKSPLITIQGFMGLLVQDMTAGDIELVKNDVTRISNAVKKMEQLLNELLELSRIGRVVNPPEEIPLGELVREAVDMVAGQIQEREAQVQIVPELLQTVHGPTVYGDHPRLREVLQNLVDNAVKYMGDQAEPRIEIGTRRDGPDMVVYVRDNGIGIAPRYHEQIFGLFNKLDHASEGAGVGLTIVKRIVEVHGGRVWVESEGEGRGSTFCFTLAEKQND
jgi:signal transduction histidine kinase